MIFEISALELVRIAMLPKIKQKRPWVLHFSSLCTLLYERWSHMEVQLYLIFYLFSKRTNCQTNTKKYFGQINNKNRGFWNNNSCNLLDSQAVCFRALFYWSFKVQDKYVLICINNSNILTFFKCHIPFK